MASEKKFFNKVDMEYFGFKIFMSVMTFLPMRFVLFLVRRLAVLGFYILKGPREDALSSLSIAYPDKTEREKKYIAKQSFKNMVTTFVEFAYASKWSDEKYKEMVTAEGTEHLKKALEKNKGAVVITGHIGNWEHIPVMVNLYVSQAAFIVRSLDNPRINKYVESWRTRRGDISIDRRAGGLRVIFETLKANIPIGFLSDQNFSEGAFVYFFGKLACTATGPIAMAIKLGSPVIFAYAKRGKDYKHTVIFTEEMPIEYKDTKEKTLLHNTQRYTKILESIIRANPEEWLWAHRRWNTYPEERPNALRYDKIDQY